jgi:hypothetical protein
MQGSAHHEKGCVQLHVVALFMACCALCGLLTALNMRHCAEAVHA